MYPHRNHHQLVCTVTGCSTLDWHRVLTPLTESQIFFFSNFFHTSCYLCTVGKDIFLTQTPTFQQSHQSFFLPPEMLQAKEKKTATEGQKEAPLTQQQRRDEPAGTQNTMAQTNTLSAESSFGCDAPLCFCCDDGPEPNTPS